MGHVRISANTRHATPGENGGGAPAKANAPTPTCDDHSAKACESLIVKYPPQHRQQHTSKIFLTKLTIEIVSAEYKAARRLHRRAGAEPTPLRISGRLAQRPRMALSWDNVVTAQRRRRSSWNHRFAELCTGDFPVATPDTLAAGLCGSCRRARDSGGHRRRPPGAAC